MKLLPDRAALEALYHATDGSKWVEAGNWATNASVRHWAGVSTDASGSVVTGLDLTGKGLAGRIPSRFGNLTQMTVLRIGGNPSLAGRLPRGLTRLPLQELHYADTSVCVPPDTGFQTWLAAIPSHEGTGIECEPLSDREILEIFYEATGGPNWIRNDNWLSDAPLGEWFGIWTDDGGAVVRLDLSGNGLSGWIPPEIGDLTALQQLWLGGWNDLSGPIPPEIGNLAALEDLVLIGNAHSGPIPAEIGNLTALKRLDLYDNDLTGPIPPEIGNLAALEYLELAWNDLSGPIPPEIGGLAALEYLGLYSNRNLSGPIPSEIGSLGQLQYLGLAFNDFSGPIPAEVGDLARLEELSLAFNDFSGPIPPWIDRLTALKELNLGRNRFSGWLPPTIGDLARLETLDLHLNDLAGPGSSGDRWAREPDVAESGGQQPQRSGANGVGWFDRPEGCQLQRQPQDGGCSSGRPDGSRGTRSAPSLGHRAVRAIEPRLPVLA
ncbi:MAG: hypothetical protein OXN18_12085 [Gemmatimonadota bacterium]|nr:hypothetical protein [Gemmatimonadota bacterium]